MAVDSLDPLPWSLQIRGRGLCEPTALQLLELQWVALLDLEYFNTLSAFNVVRETGQSIHFLGVIGHYIDLSYSEQTCTSLTIKGQILPCIR